MFEFTNTQPQLNVQESEYLRLLGYPPGHVLGDRSRELAAWARSWFAENGRPWIAARAAGGLDLTNETIRVDGVEFASSRLRSQFVTAEVHDAALVAVSAGAECEAKAHECWADGKPDEYFFLEMYGSAVVEHLVTLAAGHICAWADHNGMAVLPHYSPGYTGWPISDQPKLFRLIAHDRTSFPFALQALDTGMLRPKKSLLAVFGLTRNREKVRTGHMIPCENCSLSNCQYRRTIYRVPMPQPEVFSRSPKTSIATELNGNGIPALDLNARYSINTRALRKWAQERLHVEVAADGSVSGRFRYEGTTCSNFGLPILYDHYVRLRPSSEKFRIEELHCAPAVGDVGNDSQCEYLKDAEGFTRRIAAEKPLLNRPLNDVLNWPNATNPAGCYCDVGSREHKWKIALEVLHFALAQREHLLSNGDNATLLKSELTYDKTV